MVCNLPASFVFISRAGKEPTRVFAAIALSTQAEADRYCVVHFIHKRFIQPPHPLTQTGLIDCSYLFKKYHAVAAQPAALRRKLNMGRKPCFAHLRGDSGRYYRRAMFVARIILNDEHGSHSPLLTADNGTEVGIINVSSSNCAHYVSHSDDRLPATFYVVAY